jgi:ribose transport system substrate-binding protein
MKRFLALMGALMLLVAACGGGGTGQTAKKPVIGVSFPIVEGPWFVAALYGIVDEAQKNGYDTVILSAGGYQNVDKQVGQMSDLIQRHVDAILMAPSDPNALAPQAAAAKAAGIPVVGTGEVVSSTNGSVTADHCALGTSMGKGAKTLLPGGGTLAALKGPAGAFWTETRWTCFTKELQGSNIQIVAQQSSEPDVAQGLRIASDFLQRYPNLNLMYGVDDTVGTGAAQAIQQANKCGKVQVVTAILGTEAERLMKAGCIQYLVAQQVVKIGRDSVDAAIKLLKHESIPSVQQIPDIIVTPANVGTVDISTMRNPSDWRPTIG